MWTSCTLTAFFNAECGGRYAELKNCLHSALRIPHSALNDDALATAGNCMHGLVDGARAAEAELAVEPDGGLVAGGDFQVRFRQAGDSETEKCLQEQEPTKAATAVAGHHAEVLHRPKPLVAHPLHRAARAERAHEQPRRFRHKIGPRRDVPHQLPAAV